MSAYLARLKQLENEKNSHYAPDTVPTKPTQPPFDSFGSTDTGHIEKKIKVRATVAQANELKALLAIVYARDTPADQAEALEAALADPVDALTCYRAIAEELRHAKVLKMLGTGRKYAVLVEDEKTDPVIATVAIRGVATFEMAIPKHSYNGLVLMELIERHGATTH